MKRGLFISLEGIEATGKTTVAKLLKEKLLSSCGEYTMQENPTESVLITREPGGVKVSEEIRKTIMDNDIDEKTEVLLFLAARREHLMKKILPGLEVNDYVICDRYVHSTLAYQGYGYGANINDIFTLNNYATNRVLPDLTFVIDIPVDVSIARKKEVEEQNRLDHMDKMFYERVREGYLELSEDNKYGNIHIIDGEQSIEKIAEDMLNEIKLFQFTKSIMETPNFKTNVLDRNNIINFPKEDK